jgi:hypothetical protein
MRRWFAIAFVVTLAASASAQTRRPVRKPEPPPPAAPEKVAPDMTCPTPLGVGLKTKRAFCDVMTGRDPAEGILIKIPPHSGPVELTFDLHNRHTYSEEQVKANRAYASYTATVGVLTMDNTLISRAVVQNEFRKASDLVDRVGGGAGPGGAKAVAPTGTEPITITIPESENQVSILGEKLTVARVDGSATYTSPGRPIAVISNVMIEYRPAPPPKPGRAGGAGGAGRAGAAGRGRSGGG